MCQYNTPLGKNVQNAQYALIIQVANELRPLQHLTHFYKMKKPCKALIYTASLLYIGKWNIKDDF